MRQSVISVWPILRLSKSVASDELAEKFEKPVVTLIDTPGAYPGMEAEERGQGEASQEIFMNDSLKGTRYMCNYREGASGEH